MRKRTYPGRLTRQEWLALPSIERMVLARRAEADLLGMWRTCSKKPCRRAHGCLGDNMGKKICTLRAYEADFKNPNLGQPGFQFSFRLPDHVRTAEAVIKHLQFGIDLLPAEDIVHECEVQEGVDVAAAMRLVLRLQRRRRRRLAVLAR